MKYGRGREGGSNRRSRCWKQLAGLEKSAHRVRESEPDCDSSRSRPFFDFPLQSDMASSSRSVRMLGRRAFHSSRRTMHQAPVLPRHGVEVGPMQLSRLEEHYHNTLAKDLLYMTYEHPSATSSASSNILAEEASPRQWDPASPYSKNRPTRPNRGNRMSQPSSAKYDQQVVQLEQVYITAFCKDAVANKQALIPLLAQMRAITGKPILGSLADPTAAYRADQPKTGYVQIIRSKAGAASFKLRAGMPIAVQAVLPSKSAYTFLEVFTTFVLPRLRTFPGFYLPPSSQPKASPAASSGVVSLGMGPEALALFPQTEVNWDSYPNRAVGFQVSIISD
jgi:large subunit ribosomal protein L5